jgi:hypothetical protein
MSEKTFKIVGDDMSDGYHTFGELYDHRCLLFAILATSEEFAGDSYVVEGHYPGWDLLVIKTDFGQISYHVPVRLRTLYDGLLKAYKSNDSEIPPWDGHTPQDVLKRLEGLMVERKSDALSA